MAVRIFRLARPAELPMRPEYAGCKSWLELESTIPPEGDPVLTDREFQEKLARFHSALEPAATV